MLMPERARATGYSFRFCSQRPCPGTLRDRALPGGIGRTRRPGARGQSDVHAAHQGVIEGGTVVARWRSDLSRRAGRGAVDECADGELGVRGPAQAGLRPRGKHEPFPVAPARLCRARRRAPSRSACRAAGPGTKGLSTRRSLRMGRCASRISPACGASSRRATGTVWWSSSAASTRGKTRS